MRRLRGSGPGASTLGGAPARSGRPGPGVAGLLVPWLVGVLVYQLLKFAVGGLLSLAGPTSGAVGPASWLGVVLLGTVPAAAAVLVARREVVLRGPGAWMLLGVPAPVLVALVHVVLAVVTGRDAGPSIAGALVAVLAVIPLAAIGAGLAGLVRTRRD